MIVGLMPVKGIALPSYRMGKFLILEYDYDGAHTIGTENV